MYLADEILKHFFGVGEVRDDPVFHRAYGGDVARRTTQHVFGFSAHGDDDLAAAAVVFLDRHHGGFVKHDPAITDVDQCVGRTEVYR